MFGGKEETRKKRTMGEKAPKITWPKSKNKKAYKSKAQKYKAKSKIKVQSFKTNDHRS